jgi:hypothetical protein
MACRSVSPLFAKSSASSYRLPGREPCPSGDLKGRLKLHLVKVEQPRNGRKWLIRRTIVPFLQWADQFSVVPGSSNSPSANSTREMSRK